MFQNDMDDRRTGNPAPVDTTTRIIEWLSGDDCYSLDEAGLVSQLGQRLVRAGMRLDRLTLHLMTLHPELLGRTWAWAPGEPVEVYDRTHDASRRQMKNTILVAARSSRQIIVAEADEHEGTWKHLDIFKGRDLKQLILVPLNNADGPVAIMVFGTTQPEGFSALDRDRMERIRPALRNTSELRVLRQVRMSVLDTYVGHTTAERILAGSIRQGLVESLDAALMLCDVRHFTEISNRLPSDKVLALLNAYFDTVLPAITANGGEVLKFMGDGFIAFFSGDAAADCAIAAYKAADQILRSLRDFETAGEALSVSIALHYGEMSYGNIGSGRRLDFTFIGADVNLLNRLQSAGAALGEELVMSAKFVNLHGEIEATSLGPRLLRGFAEPIELFVKKD